VPHNANTTSGLNPTTTGKITPSRENLPLKPSDIRRSKNNRPVTFSSRTNNCRKWTFQVSTQEYYSPEHYNTSRYIVLAKIIALLINSTKRIKPHYRKSSETLQIKNTIKPDFRGTQARSFS